MGHIVIWIHGAESGTLSNDTMLYDTDLGNPIVMWIFHKQASAPSHQPRSTQGEGSNGLLYGQKPWDKSISSYLKVETLYKFGWPTKLECFKTYNLNPKLEKGAKRNSKENSNSFNSTVWQSENPKFAESSNSYNYILF